MWKFFSPPIFEDYEKDAKAKLVRKLILGFMLIVTGVEVLLLIFQSQYYIRWVITIIALNFSCLFLVYLNSKGHSQISASIFIFFSIVLILSLSWSAGGIKSGAVQTTPAIVLAAGILLGWRRGLSIAAIILVLELGLVFAELNNLLPPASVFYSPIAFWFLSFLEICILSLLQYFTVLDLDRALFKTNKELQLRKKAEEELRKTEEFRYRVYESSTIPMVVMDAVTYKFIDCNSAAIKIYNFNSREETLGKTPYDVSAPIQYDGTPSDKKARYYINKAMKEKSITFEWKHQRPGGDLWDAEVHLMSFKVNGNQFLQFTLLDITIRKEAVIALQKSETRFKTMFNSATDSIFLMRDDIIIEANPATARMFGYTPEEISGKSVIELSPPFQADDLPSNQEALKKINRVLSGESIRFEWIHKKKNGDLFNVEVTLNSIEYKQETFLLAFVRDVSERKKAENELKELKDRFQLLFDYSPLAVTLSRLSDRSYIDINHRFTEITGWSREEVIGKTPFDISLWGIDQMGEKFVRTVLKNAVTKDFEMPIRRKDGTLRYASITAAYVELHGIVHVISIAADITERKKAEEELNRYKDHLLEMVEERTSELEQSRETFRALSENSKDIIMRVNHELKILYVNPVVQSIFKFPPDEIIGQSISKLLPSNELVHKLENLLQTILETKQTQNIELHFPNGIWADLLAMPEFDLSGNVSSIIASARDITKLKQLQIEIQQALVKEKELNQLRNRFISMVSHEYRTPLTSIMSSIELLEMGEEKFTKEKKKSHYERIQKNIDYLVSMIDEVLYVNRIESDRIKFSMQKVNLPDFCAETLNEIKEMYSYIHSEIISLLTEVNYNIEPAIMRKILSNLLSNAFKYNKDNGQVNFIIESEINKLIFRISDTGIGIPEDEQKNIYEPFHRMSNSQNIKGTGLGLSIVKKSVEQLGGKISFTSKQNEGTTFVVEIPV